MKNLSKVKDLTGKRFGRLTVIGIDEGRQSRKTYWICQCDCGKITSHRSDGLQSGSIRSCGCLKNELSAERVAKNHKHKQSGTRLYHIWQGMKRRCYTETSPDYQRWGGRGIKMCDQWRDSFESFFEWAMKSGYSDTLTIDRVDNDGDYTPDNCRWASAKEQGRNRRSNISITIGNTTKSLTEWCEIFGLDYRTVNARYKRMEDGVISLDKLFKG